MPTNSPGATESETPSTAVTTPSGVSKCLVILSTARIAPAKIAEGILRMRRGEVQVEPGYDGEYGKVHIFGEAQAPVPAGEQQMTLF